MYNIDTDTETVDELYKPKASSVKRLQQHRVFQKKDG